MPSAGERSGSPTSNAVRGELSEPSLTRNPRSDQSHNERPKGQASAELIPRLADLTAGPRNMATSPCRHANPSPVTRHANLENPAT
jgi:hypothetical protein